MAGIEHCPHCDCGNPEGYGRCMACALSPTEKPEGADKADGSCEQKQGVGEPDGWYGVTSRGKSGPYKSLREAMVRSWL